MSTGEKSKLTHYHSEWRFKKRARPHAELGPGLWEETDDQIPYRLRLPPRLLLPPLLLREPPLFPPRGALKPPPLGRS